MTRRTANTIAELGALCFAALLWLSQTVSMAHGWQLASIWITLAVTAAALAHARLPAEPLVNTGVLLITGWLFMVRLIPNLAGSIGADHVRISRFCRRPAL